jgi:hypothetical protein
MMGRILGLLTAGYALALTSCIGPLALIIADGTLGGRLYAPSTTGFAVIHRFEGQQNADGSVELVELAEPTVTLFLSGARFDPEMDLAALSEGQVADILLDVAQSDHLAVTDLRASGAGSGSHAEATRVGETTGGVFNFEIHTARQTVPRNAASSDFKPLGTDQSLELQFSTVDLRDQGRIEIQPLRLAIRGGAEQDVPAEGNVNIRLSVPIIPEWLGASNLRVLQRAFTAD